MYIRGALLVWGLRHAHIHALSEIYGTWLNIEAVWPDSIVKLPCRLIVICAIEVPVVQVKVLTLTTKLQLLFSCDSFANVTLSQFISDIMPDTVKILWNDKTNSYLHFVHVLLLLTAVLITWTSCCDRFINCQWIWWFESGHFGLDPIENLHQLW